MLPFPLVYHDGYDLNLGRHVFPSQKFRLVRLRLLDSFIAGPEDFLAPTPATGEQLRLVHTDDWVTKLETGTLTYKEIVKLEIPYSRQMVDAFFLAAGGTTLAARRALECGVSFNIGGGFHHAFEGHGEGFCAIHDVAVAIRVLQRDASIRKALVVDCDVHQGNGTAAIFANDPSVFTVSLHQENNYPSEKPSSSLDINLADNTGDREYLEKLSGALAFAMDSFDADALFYVAGVDPYFDDELGGLAITKEGMRERDRLVISSALKRGIAVCVTFAGGYARVVEDTIEMHTNTVLAACDAWREHGWRR